MMKSYRQFKKRKREEAEMAQNAGRLLFVLDLLEVFIISLAIIIPVRYFLIQPFVVNGASMDPSFLDHDYLIVDQISYRFKEPQRGDIIVFHYPRDPKQYFIKRIIALPHDRLEIRNGSVFINGEQLDEHLYLSPTVQTTGSVSLLLKGDEYFLLGDNRMSSLDSRSFGPLQQHFMVGKVWVRGWPFDKINFFDSLEYNLP